MGRKSKILQNKVENLNLFLLFLQTNCGYLKVMMPWEPK